MCGILGYYGKRSFDGAGFGRALETMKNRGPDDDGVFETPEIILGHRRLAILDLSPAGHQPMASHDGRHVIVYNGEVYNFGEFRRELQQEGTAFRSTSDTEVILELYVREGPACLRRFHGMFALAIYDTREHSLFFARDRMGIKPLYLWRFPGGIAFASEVKALRALPGGPAERNPNAVVQYLAWGSIPSPLTILKDVESLPPATWALYKDGHLKQEEYWSLPSFPAVHNTVGEALEVLRPRLLQAVRDRCVADVPVGAFLSGGVDSSSVVALMRAAGQTDIRTFSISFPQTHLDEGPYALKVAEQFDTIHADVSVTPHLVEHALEGFFASMDQPTCDGLNTYLVSKFARQGGVTVSLSGLGGDELFAGYSSFRRTQMLTPWLRRFPRLIPWGASKVGSRISGRAVKLEALALQGPLASRLYFASRGLFMPSQIRQLLQPDFLAQTCLVQKSRGTGDCFLPPTLSSLDTLHEAMALELRRYMHNQLLRDCDVFGMANALEIRVPLIDHQIAESLFSTAPEVILGNGPKHLLLAALPEHLPRICTHRPKMGFTFPFADWMRGPWRGILEPTFLSSGQETRGGIFRSSALRRLWTDYQNGHLYWIRPWSIYALQRSMELQEHI